MWIEWGEFSIRLHRCVFADHNARLIATLLLRLRPHGVER